MTPTDDHPKPPVEILRLVARVGELEDELERARERIAELENDLEIARAEVARHEVENYGPYHTRTGTIEDPELPA